MAASAGDVRPVGTTQTRVVTQVGEETKPSFKTTEFAVLILTVAGVMIAARLDDGLDGLWAAILIAALSIGYMLSRGLAKSGTRYVDHD
jgi:hypothetical protein